MKIVLAGGAGSLGRRLAADLTAHGYAVVILTRDYKSSLPYRQVVWDGKSVGGWARELSNAALINLAGELVDRRPTTANIDLLRRSRVEPTKALAVAAATLDQPVTTFIQISTLAIYGDAGDAILDESAPEATKPPQMAGVARVWEEAANSIRAERKVILRTGIVLDTFGPAMRRLTGLARWGLGGTVGTGRQWISWLHYADFQRIVTFVLDRDDLSGIVHATSPHPAKNAHFMRTLRTAIGRSIAIPTPTPAVRIGAWLMGTDPALALTGRRCVPAKLLRAHYQFAYPDLSQALQDLVTKPYAED